MTDPTTTPAVVPAVEATPASTRPCLCGCGQTTSSVWAPGHDGRAKGLLRAVARGEKKIDSLPAALAAQVPALIQRWKMGTVETNDEGSVVAIHFNAAAKAPTTKRPASSHPAVRTLLRAKDQLADREDLVDIVNELIETLSAE